MKQLLCFLLLGVSAPVGAREMLDDRMSVPEGALMTEIQASPRGAFAHTIYLQMNGGSYHSPADGNDDPPNNESWIVDTQSGDATVQPFQPLEPEKQAAMLRCVQLMFGRFNVEVTNVEPPAATPYIEAVVTGGASLEIGLPNSILGIAPASCDVLEPAVVWIFGAFYDNDVQATCETAAQEIAHAYGLDHEMLCEDPMTYKSGCHPKTFQDRESQCGACDGAGCGDPGPRSCMCGQSTQNSVQTLISRLGPGEIIAPTVTITGPGDGTSLTGSFTVTADAQDNYIIAKTELVVDGTVLTSDEAAPYEMIVPKTTPPGSHTIVVNAYDANANKGSATITVTTEAECTSDDMCPGEGQHCNEWYCAGELGSECDAHEDCVAGTLCGFEGTEGRCTQSCSSSDNTCPGGFECLTGVGGTGKCWPSDGGGGCGCVVGGRTGLGLGGLLFAAGVLAALVGRRRQRRISL